MYLTEEAVVAAISHLRQTTHPFLGITFLACCRERLPIGSTTKLSVDALTKAHMQEYHMLDRSSAYFFQPFKSNSEWVKANYPSTGLQSINTQTFVSTFIHPHGSDEWGFEQDFLKHISQSLLRTRHRTKPSLLALAIWILKSAQLDDDFDQGSLISTLKNDFNLTDEICQALFDTDLNALGFIKNLFSDEPIRFSDLLEKLSPAPDSAEDVGMAISSLRLTNVGPAKLFEVEFGERLTVIAGDNGLGKSFLLDFAWWATTGIWADRPAFPFLASLKASPTSECVIRTERGRTRKYSSTFDVKTYSWRLPRRGQPVSALAIYARADGSFVVCDPMRLKIHNDNDSGVIRISGSEAMNGKTPAVQGLVHDWVRWQHSYKVAFDRFCSVLRTLSPEDLGELRAGDTMRIPLDSRDIPTIQHLYGEIPITYASSGVQRMLILAYLVIWAWHEHELLAGQLSETPLRRMVVVVDELEAHLHPKWQRTVLPALMDVGALLSSELSIQTITATHSPLIMASLEGAFREDKDNLYHLFAANNEVQLESIDFQKFGDVSSWLTSPIFGLRHARSRDADRAIEAAKALQIEDDPTFENVNSVHELLKRYLAPDDKFWPRWIYFAELHGVSV